MKSIENIYIDLTKNIKKTNVLKNELMSNHTSFKIGGPVDILVEPGTIEEIKYAVDYCRKEGIEFYIFGNGSNILIKDSGIRGVVIKLSDNFNKVTIDENKVNAESGILLSRLSKIIMKEELEGFEFASGIPGTLGGAITMNAGAYGGEIKHCVTGAKVLNRKGEIVYLNNEQLDFGYRKSTVQKEGYIVLEVDMEFKRGSYEKIKMITDDLTKKRTSKQPLHLPSAGSTFKRPPGYYAGKLIDDAGLRGVRVGDAMVSDKHCGFIVNVGNATSEDVLNLIKLVQKVVKDKFDVDLETEVKIIGAK